MNINIIARGSPNDVFFFGIFEECLKIIPQDSDVFYIWAEPLSNFESMLNSVDFNSKNIFIFVPDDLTDRNFMYGNQLLSWAANIFYRFANKHIDTNFVLITDLINLGKELTHCSNIKTVECEFMGLLENEYRLINPVIDKNFNSKKTSIGLFGSPTRSRISMMCYLYQQNLVSNMEVFTGKYTASNLEKNENFLDLINWEFDPAHEKTIKPILIEGYKILRKLHRNSSGFGTPNHATNTCENLDQHHRELYRNSFVEIVSETYYEEPSFWVSDKTLNSIFGCNFFLLLSSAGTVSHLRKLGVDVFDDVVNHSYDDIANPIDRMMSIIQLNQRLLTDAKYAKSKWLENKYRFIDNVHYIKTKFHQLIKKRVLNDLKMLLLK